jgi:hypothetical protein
MANVSTVIPVTLPNGSKIRIESRTWDVAGKREKVGITELRFADLIPSIGGISETVLAAIKKVAPKKASVEFGVEVSIESGKLMALLCSGGATANLKITLEWEEEK